MEAFGRYVSDEQRWGLARALLEKGYEVSTCERGGWGGGTEWTVRRWRTRHYVLLGWILPMLALGGAFLSGNDIAIAAALVFAMPSAFFFGLPLFTATFMWWDSETAWTASGGGQEFEELIPVVEAASGRKVRRRVAKAPDAHP